jgi:hypothetical protein
MRTAASAADQRTGAPPAEGSHRHLDATRLGFASKRTVPRFRSPPHVPSPHHPAPPASDESNRRPLCVPSLSRLCKPYRFRRVPVKTARRTDVKSIYFLPTREIPIRLTSCEHPNLGTFRTKRTPPTMPPCRASGQIRTGGMEVQNGHTGSLGRGRPGPACVLGNSSPGENAPAPATIIRADRRRALSRPSPAPHPRQAHAATAQRHDGSGGREKVVGSLLGAEEHLRKRELTRHWLVITSGG